MWATYEFYTDKFLLNDTPLIPKGSFPRWEARAVEAINWRNVKFPDDFSPPEYLKKAVCAVADILFTNSQAPKPGELISETNANYSWKAAESAKREDLKSDIRSAINQYLAGTPLHNLFVYRGVT